MHNSGIYHIPLLHSLGSTIVVSTLGAHAVHRRPIPKSAPCVPYSLRNEESLSNLTLKRAKQLCVLMYATIYLSFIHSFTEPCTQLIFIYNMVNMTKALRLISDIAWLAVVFGINSTHNAVNCSWLCLVLLIPNTTATMLLYF